MSLISRLYRRIIKKIVRCRRRRDDFSIESSAMNESDPDAPPIERMHLPPTIPLPDIPGSTKNEQTEPCLNYIPLTWGEIPPLKETIPVVKVPIEVIPPEIRLKIVEKLSTRVLRRFMQTTKSAEAFVEKFKHQIETPLWVMKLSLNQKVFWDEICYSYRPLSINDPERVPNGDSILTTHRIPPRRVYSIFLNLGPEASHKKWVQLLGEQLKTRRIICDKLVIDNCNASREDTKNLLSFFVFSHLVMKEDFSEDQMPVFQMIPECGVLDVNFMLRRPSPIEDYISHLSKVTVRDTSEESAVRYIRRFFEKVRCDRKERGNLRTFKVLVKWEDEKSLQTVLAPHAIQVYTGVHGKRYMSQRVTFFTMAIQGGMAYIFKYKNTYEVKIVNDGEQPHLTSFIPQAIFSNYEVSRALSSASTLEELFAHLKENAKHEIKLYADI